MNRMMKRCAAPIAALVLFGSTARADAIRPWSGASASVWEPNSSVQWAVNPPPTQSQTGAIAAASAQGDVPFTFYGPNYSGGPPPLRTAAIHGSADAQATGRAEDLLRAGATYTTSYPGTVYQPLQGPGLVQATASWTGDRALIQGSSLPGVARLNFSVDLNARIYEYGPFGGAVVKANNQTMTLDHHYEEYQPPLNHGFDSFTITTAKPYGGGFHTQATFHLDLPVNSSGLSDPFRLSLQVTPDSGLSSNYAINSGPIGDAILSLTSITTTDGRLLSDLGDSVTFTSGMLAPGVQPMPIPEPSSIVVMMIAAIGLSRYFRR